MRDRARLGRVLLSLLGAASLLAWPVSAAAQAWLPPKGEATFSLVYQNIYMRDHLLAHGQRAADLGHMYYQNVLADLSYSVTDRLSLRLNIPFVAGKYTGNFPHLIPIDDGTYHGTFQDFRFEARYNALKAPIVVTPFVGAVLPSHSYEHYAHAAPGAGLRQLLVGTSVGRRLDPFLPEAFFQGRYSYAIVQRLEDIANNTHNRSNAAMEIGYFVKPSIQVFALAMGQKTHGGIDFIRGKPFGTGTVPELHNHDRIARADFLDLGGGASYAVNGSLDVFASWQTTVAGQNGHATNRGLSFGMTIGFSPERILRKMSHRPAEPVPPS